MQQEIQKVCEYCQDSMAVTSCEVCGSKVCADCKLEYGCEVCGGGETTLE